jgi:Flp pilus assembly protein TadD
VVQSKLKEGKELDSAPRTYRALGEASVEADGLRLLKSGDFSGAERVYRTAVQRRPSEARFRDGLGTALSAQKRWGEGEPQHREAVRLAPNNWEFALRYGENLSMQGKLKEAEAALQTCLRLNANADAAYVRLGHVYYSMQDYAHAENCYRRAVQLFPRHGPYRADLAGALYRLGRVPDARTEASEARRLGMSQPHWVFQALQIP